MTHLAPIAFLILLAHLLVSPSQSVEPIETKWRQLIEADLRNGDPEGDLCAKAKRRAALSDDVAFKNWAYEIARRTYPSAGRVSTAAQTIQSSTASTNCPLLSSQDARRVARGERVKLAGDGCTMIFNGVK